MTMLVATALMGALSSLVVTACVAPPLVAALAVMLSGESARGITAQAINVDGGQLQN